MRPEHALLRRLRRRWWAVTVASLLAVGSLAPAAQADDTTPPAPTGLEVVEEHIGHHHVQLQWEGTRQQSYRIYWQEADDPESSGSFDPSVIWAGTNLVRGSVFGLELDTTYVFEVVEVGADGDESPPSNQVTATTLPLVPTGVEVNSASTTVVNLSWAGVHGEWYRIFWHEADNPENAGSETLSYKQSYPSPRPPGVDAVISGLSPGTTYVFELAHLDGGPDGEESELSDPLTFMTPPYDPPAVQAELDGNDVTLTWPKPPNIRSNVQVSYEVHLDGVLETRVVTAADPAQVTIPRQTSGTTPEYAVHHSGWIDPSITDPVTVTIPPSNDTTAPTAPGWVWTDGPPLDCGESPEMPMYEIVDESTDDVTHPSEIRYEGLTPHPLTGELYVFDHDLPLTGPVAPERIRAVDEAGNRSEAVTGTFVTPAC